MRVVEMLDLVKQSALMVSEGATEIENWKMQSLYKDVAYDIDAIIKKLIVKKVKK